MFAQAQQWLRNALRRNTNNHPWAAAAWLAWSLVATGWVLLLAARSALWAETAAAVRSATVVGAKLGLVLLVPHVAMLQAFVGRVLWLSVVFLACNPLVLGTAKDEAFLACVRNATVDLQ